MTEAVASGTRRTSSARIAHAILLVQGRYAMQLRDNKPAIMAPGMWGLFGGRVEDGEAPADGLARELDEELGLKLDRVRLFWTVRHGGSPVSTPARYWFYEADVTAEWPQHALSEGQAAQLFDFADLPKQAMAPLIWRALLRHRKSYFGRNE